MLFLSVAIFSFFVNLLMLTGPIFMLQVYDRVLSSRSEATLLALIVIMGFLFLMMGVLDYARGRVLARAGARFQARLDNRVFEAILRRSVSPVERARPATGLRDLESIQRLLSGPAPFAVFDMPWTPVFLAAIFTFHWILGCIAIGGGLILVCLTWLNQIFSKKLQIDANVASAQSEGFTEAVRSQGETVQGLGMRRSVLERWQKLRGRSLETTIQASDRTGGFSTASKTLRFFLQSLMLGAGAWLAIQGELSPGSMIAGSILMGRALAPIEQAIGQWALVQRAVQGWKSLSELLEKTPAPEVRTKLPEPRSILEAQQVTVVAPGEQTAAIRMVSFRMEPGQAMGVIGPSASGKSTLAKAIVGIWKPAAGNVRLDGAALEQYGDEDLGRHVGYLPQEIALFDGTVAENIARLTGEPDAEAVVLAAKRAGAHEMILGLPGGYDFQVAAGGGKLSGGQRQRIGLARALYGDPAVVVLDEPNSNLDAAGSDALNRAIVDIKARGRSVIIMAHRPAAIQHCDLILMMEDGVRKAFGPKDEVLRQHVRNYPQVVTPAGE
ncbi:type I secretion system permease/ATPase [Albimonas sp. CAU 1670]|uniref:type I secretion system permease/ATPase n=1 Tax=Albimonas sp. CAU 1670 TaxID=3032599 RepID=UPI0023D9C6A1|nr:type I secretion system permease/ATPase [Albimonas sp. CAU 1670]MDF2233532.1 type I secretion system permease/ATPase [Albimonas sp. CAU 1670]